MCRYFASPTVAGCLRRDRQEDQSHVYPSNSRLRDAVVRDRLRRQGGAGFGDDSVLGPSAISASPDAETSSSSAATTHASRDVIVNMHDACDPDTFNAVLAPAHASATEV